MSGQPAGPAGPWAEYVIEVPYSWLARWIELVDFCLENGPEAVDGLLEMAEQLEFALYGRGAEADAGAAS